MNEIRRYGRDPDELALMREIVGGREFPDFVTDFDVQVGEFDGDPAAWITFTLADGDYVGMAEMTRRGKILDELRRSIKTQWFEQRLEPYPYFRYNYAEAV